MDPLKFLEPIFRPQSIAVLGASDQVEKWGYRMVSRPLRTGFRGTVYPINPHAQEICGHQAWAKISDLPHPVDLAIIVLPASIVGEALRECLQHGIRGAIIISAGFAEVGPEGKALQDELVQIAVRAHIPLIGPNCMGIWSEPVALNLAFDEAPHQGSLAFISQSGTLGNYLMLLAKGKGYGFSAFVSSGNQALLEVADFLEYFGQDPATRAIILYLEGLQDAQRFARVGQEVVRKKPILIYKAGRFEVGARAALSHTASMAGNDNIFEALCKQLGIIRCYDPIHTFDMAVALANQPLPRGNHVGIISGGGGYCVTMAEAAVAWGLQVPPLAPEDSERIKKLLLPFAPQPWNPVDTASDTRPMAFARVLEELMQLDYLDGVMMLPPFAFPYQLRSPASVRELMDATEIVCALPQKYHKPLIGNTIPSIASGPSLAFMQKAGIPFYATQDESARAMYALVRYGKILSTGV